MKQINQEKFQSRKNKFLFGSAAAIITNLGIIAGLFSSHNARGNIIGSILVIAIADNISDTLGIHIYQEAEGLESKRSVAFFIYEFYFKISRFPDIRSYYYGITAQIGSCLLPDSWFIDYLTHQLFYRCV